MNLKDEDLRRLYRSYITVRTPGNRKGCPSLESLVLFFESRARTRKKLKIIDHITNCSPCAKEFDFLLELQRYQNQMIQQAQRAQPIKQSVISWPALLKRAGPLWRFSPVFIGAMLVIASLVIIIQKWGRFDRVRATSSSVALIQPNQKHPASSPLMFKWKEVNGAEKYILELYDEALLQIWKSSEIPLPHLILSEDIASRLQSNKSYFWMITAYRKKEKLAESELVRFIIIPKKH